MTKLSIGDRTLKIDLKELAFPLVVLAFCGLYYTDTRGLPDRSLLYADPILYGTTLFALAVIAVFAVRIDPDDTGDDRSTGSMTGFASDSWQTRTVVTIVLLTGGYLVAIRVQFAAATVLFLGGALYALGERDPRILVAYPVVLTAVIYTVFVLWLNIPL